MTEVTQLRPVPTFDDFWKRFPAGRRRRKALCRQMWDEITNGGRLCRTKDAEGSGFVSIHVEATPEEIMDGLNAWVRSLPLNDDFSIRDEQYVCTSPVWLNQSRWEDA